MNPNWDCFAASFGNPMHFWVAIAKIWLRNNVILGVFQLLGENLHDI